MGNSNAMKWSRTRGAVIHVIGRKEIEQYQRHSMDLSHCEGLHVICALDGVVVTTYRNRDLSGLRR
jgi:hypothetical protein